MESTSHQKQGIDSRKKTYKSHKKEGSLFILFLLKIRERINTKPIGLSVVP
jgi:hypothetical protein